MNKVRHYMPGLETILLGIFFIITGWILIGSFYLSSDASKLFPRLSAGIVLILFVLLFLKQILPNKLLEKVPKQNTLKYGGDESSTEEFDEQQVVIVFLMFGAFIIGVYMFGFLIATPVYVYASLQYFEYGTKRRKLIIGFIAFVVVLLSYDVFRIPLTQGRLFDILL